MKLSFTAVKEMEAVAAAGCMTRFPCSGRMENREFKYL